VKNLAQGMNLGHCFALSSYPLAPTTWLRDRRCCATV
jgi:hypothetical protein